MKKVKVGADNVTPVVNPGCKLSWRISGHCQPLRTLWAEESDHISSMRLKWAGLIIRHMLESGFNVLMLYSCSMNQGGPT